MFERRFPVSARPAHAAVTWRVDRVDHRSAPQRHRWPRRPEYAEVIDASVAGARLIAPFTAELQVGSHTVIEVRHVAGPVIIRRIGWCTDLTLSVYGIEFAEPDSALAALVYETFVGGASPRPDRP